MKDKISAAQSVALLKTASVKIRGLVEEKNKLAQERDEAMAKVAQYEKDEKVAQIAKSMEEKGLNADLDYEEKVAMLRNGDTDLKTVEAAVKMASPQTGRLGSLSDLGSGDSKSAFEHFINTGE